uniref:Putative salivary lipocalin n=1 Tax=Ixodes ricinus TaxID=34613 RepID=A0A0K8R9Y8_IXORI
MKTFFSLMIAALYPFVKCSQECSCPPLQDVLVDDANFNIFRDPWPFLRSADRLYLKYIPLLKKLEDIICVISDLIRNDSSSPVERNVSWTDISTTPYIRKHVNVEIQEARKSKTEFSVIKDEVSYDFETVYADSKCLIVKISRTYTGLERACLLWVKEKYLKNPLRHCSFLYFVFCNWQADDLNPTEGCDKNVKEADTNLKTTGGDNKPPR